MHHATNAMAHIITKHAVTVRLGKGLNGITDVPDMVTGNSLLNGSLKAITRDLAQSLGFGVGVPMKTSKRYRRPNRRQRLPYRWK